MSEAKPRWIKNDFTNDGGGFQAGKKNQGETYFSVPISV